MSGIFGALSVSDNERAFISTLGQDVVFDAVNQVLADYNREISLQLACFVERETESFKERYLLPGGGKLQQLGDNAPAAAVKRYGYYDTAYPLRSWGAQLAGNRIALAYLTLQELDAHLDTIMIQDLNTMRWRILTGIFEDTNLTWTDPIHGSLTIRRLANTDGTTFPPKVGTETEADDDHYSETSYAVSEISDTNDPLVTLRDEIAEHFGGRGSAGRPFVVFHNSAATAKLEALTDYTDIPDRFITPGANTATPSGQPNVPGRIHGRCAGCWLSEWDWITATYMIGLLLDVPPPLKMRVDPADVGLGRGLQLVATDRQHPMQGSHYEHRYGLGCGNRLSAAVIEITTGAAGTYAPPSDYAE